MCFLYVDFLGVSNYNGMRNVYPIPGGSQEGENMKKYAKYLLAMALVFMVVCGMRAQAHPLRVSAPSKAMYVRQKIQLKVTPSSMKKKVKWKSSNRKVASVASNGKVTARKAGRAKIYAVSTKDNKEKAVCQITVRDFKVKALASNCSVVRNGSRPLPSIGKKYKVFHSQAEVNQFLKEDQENGGHVSYYLEKKLKSYKKGFFKKKSLCVVFISTEGSGSTPVLVESIKLVQDKNGKVKAKLRAGIGVQPPDEAWTCDMATYYAVAELKKSDAQMIQGYTVEKFMMVKLPTIYD